MRGAGGGEQNRLMGGLIGAGLGYHFGGPLGAAAGFGAGALAMGGNGSGDIFLAFSTANPQAGYGDVMGISTIQTLSNDHVDPLFSATSLAVEEAIINSMVAAADMIGHKGVSIKALPHDKTREILKQYNRLTS